ncbi:carboxypeptidase-like regulatory domain-containing protein [Flavobacterium sp. RHBU_24]|uniref:carboxypeptidase-like regulatory domain-containing protein n=1 Tax=Flavobacterium sp. RHBU_24 TaxID=3391185 RepID=UPI003984CFF8
MKPKLLLSLFAFLLFAFTLTAQSVTGTIVDANKEPIPYVSVMIGPTYGVVSNEEGAFIIAVPENPEADKVTFSSIGFENLEVPLDNFKGGTFTLKEKVNELDNVFITNKKYTPTEILTLAVQNAPKNYAAQDTKQTFFLRSSSENKMIDTKFELLKSSLEKKSKLKELNNEIEELISKNKGRKSLDFSEYYGFLYQQNTATKVAVEKAIKLINKENDISGEQMNNKLIAVIKKHLEPGATYKLKTGLLTLDDSLSLEKPQKEKETGPETADIKGRITELSLSLNKFYTDEALDFLTEFKRYTYTLEGFSTFNDETIYIIDFQPKKNAAKYSGKIYVNAIDFAVVKLDYAMIDGKTEHNVNLKFLLGIKAVEDRVKVSATYTKNEAGQYAVNFVKKESNTYYYISRPLKFTKNKVDKDEEDKMMKIDLLIEGDNHKVSELFIIDREKIKPESFASVKENTNYEIKTISKYDASEWENYNVLAPVDAIKNYK